MNLCEKKKRAVTAGADGMVYVWPWYKIWPLNQTYTVASLQPDIYCCITPSDIYRCITPTRHIPLHHSNQKYTDEGQQTFVSDNGLVLTFVIWIIVKD